MDTHNIAIFDVVDIIFVIVFRQKSVKNVVFNCCRMNQ